jgi:glycosyltransferase involved in cell wall biosynthesis
MKKKVSICVCTYFRNSELERLLSSISALEFNKSNQPDLIVVIIDNTEFGFAKNIVDQVSKSFPFEIQYVIEPIKGIASARNRAINLSKDCGLIAFVDDDEIVDPNWLDELLKLQKEMDADLVSGPVFPLYENTPPNWVIKGKFFERKKYPNGFVMKYAATNNLLIRSDLLRKYSNPFDTRFNLTGGEDTAFTTKIIQEGASCYWADKAITYEYNNSSRFTVSWILLRALRIGWTLTIVEKYFHKSFPNLLLRFTKSIFHILKGIIFLFPYLIIMGYAGFIKSLSFIFRGIGELLGFTPIKYQPYK